MTADYAKPLPMPGPVSQPFFDALKRHKLLIMRCRSCGTPRLSEHAHCPECWSDDYEWVEASGRGKMYSFVVMHQNLHPGFAQDIPYNVALVDLAEGPRILSNVVGCSNEELAVNMRVEAVFDDVTDNATLLRFQPASD